jgi:hypothetical protein
MSGSGNSVQETADQVQEAENNVQLYNYQQQYYQPYIAKFVKQQTGDAASPAQANNVKGQVNAEVMKGLSQTTANPRDNNAANLTKQTDLAAGMETAGQETAGSKVKQRQLGNIQNIIDIGRGQQTNALQNQDAIAGQSVQSAIQNKEADLQLTGSMEDAAGSVVGGAAAGYMGGKKSQLAAATPSAASPTPTSSYDTGYSQDTTVAPLNLVDTGQSSYRYLPAFQY